MVYSSAVHGWKTREWRDRVMGRGPTITVIRSTKGKTCGGYLHIPWQEIGGETEDEQAFIFSLDNLTKYFPKNY